MDKEERERISWRQLSPASADQLSCVKRRSTTRPIVIIFAEDSLSFIAFKPFGESGRAFGVRRIFEHSRIINKRFGVISLAANRHAHIRMLRMNVFTA